MVDNSSKIKIKNIKIKYRLKSVLNRESNLAKKLIRHLKITNVSHVNQLQVWFLHVVTVETSNCVLLRACVQALMRTNKWWRNTLTKANRNTLINYATGLREALSIQVTHSCSLSIHAAEGESAWPAELFLFICPSSVLQLLANFIIVTHIVYHKITLCVSLPRYTGRVGCWELAV